MKVKRYPGSGDHVWLRRSSIWILYWTETLNLKYYQHPMGCRKHSGYVVFWNINEKEWQKVVAALIIGLGIGVLSGIFGAGGGVMILLALIVLMSFPLHKAIGTSTLIMAITALSSTVGYAARGSVDFLLGSVLWWEQLLVVL